MGSKKGRDTAITNSYRVEAATFGGTAIWSKKSELEFFK